MFALSEGCSTAFLFDRREKNSMIMKKIKVFSVISRRSLSAIILLALLAQLVIACLPAATKPSNSPAIAQTKETKEEKAVRTPGDIKPQPPAHQGPMTGPNGKELQDPGQKKNPYADAQITVEVIPSDNKTYGYKILVNGKTFMHLVHQSSIPGLPGHKGFQTEEDARKVAEFVAGKIHKNEVPPTVTHEDLKRLGVLKE